MIDHQNSAKQWTDADIENIYNRLLAAANEKSELKGPPSEYQIVSGYAVRVAQNSTLPEFKQFIRTGLPVNPVKMTPAEMELLQGGYLARLFHDPPIDFSHFIHAGWSW